MKKHVCSHLDDLTVGLLGVSCRLDDQMADVLVQLAHSHGLCDGTLSVCCLNEVSLNAFVPLAFSDTVMVLSGRFTYTSNKSDRLLTSGSTNPAMYPVD